MIYPTNNKAYKRLSNSYYEKSVVCCGHRNTFSKVDKIVCPYCGKYVFKDKRTEFKYRLMEEKNS